MRAGFGGRAGDGELAAFGAVPGRDAMTPPKLARDAPVADVVHPMVISLIPILGHELDPAVLHRGLRFFRQRLHAHEPLRGDERLDDGLAALARSDGELMRLDLHEEALTVEIRDDAFAGLEAIETA